MTDINVNALSEAINDKLDRDMDNLLVESTESKNISTWSNNVSNCITEIPQDINLELNNGTLTLKAGSKIYMPNGFEADGTTPKFDIIITDHDITSSSTNNGVYFMCLKPTYDGLTGLANTYSGSTSPGQSSCFWYDTIENKIKRFTSSSTTPDMYVSFPICKITVSNGAYSSIDQVFNGFGYIGSTVFVLPGVKGLIPNGRNSDGTLKNTLITCSSVLTRTYTTESANNVWFNLQSNFIGGLANGVYDEANNYLKNSSGQIQPGAIFATATLVSGKIQNWNPHTAFHAVDYSEADFVIAYQRPTSSNNYTWYRLYKSGWVEQGGLFTNSARLTQITFPIVMADTNYNALSNLQYGSEGWSSTVTTCIANNSRTTTGLQILCYYNSSYNTGLICWRVEGFAA